jgi:NAD(P)-dependent dehydrogenase (short-subunit alcohol dehydrogenase family)
MNAAAPALDFHGRTVLITGAAGGLGLAFAEAFAAAGADLVLGDIAADAMKRVADDLAKRHREQRILGLPLDVTQEESTRLFAEKAVHAVSGRERIDVLVNNAAIYAGLTRAGFHELDPAEWDRVMMVNLKGPFLMARAVRPWMLGAGGRIVNLASATVFSGTPLWAHYVASKGGVIALTRVLATELGPHGITVNAIAPGTVNTAMPRAAGVSDADLIASGRAFPLGRIAEPEDMLGALLFLCGDGGAYITGQVLHVNGGSFMP